ncbi:hypothetical protein [Pseudomonas defluvii]|uniref:hypothetical protein n=1 Tax=Pseudomonas defluvii TaxID=1876757 RepID=UPI0008112C72|nr:hypothetical protein [Pseudomonas defluvii]
MGVEVALVTALVAGTAMSAYSSVQQGRQAKLTADAQSDQAQIDADNAASAAVVQADRIRKMARIQAGEANAALAASGVEVGAGTAVNINEEIYKNAEEDAAMTIFNGENQRKRGYVDASNISLAGRQAQSSANMQAAGTVLGGTAQGFMGYSNWKASAGSNGKAAGVGGNG